MFAAVIEQYSTHSSRLLNSVFFLSNMLDGTFQDATRSRRYLAMHKLS